MEKYINQTLITGLVVIFPSLFNELLQTPWIKNEILLINPLKVFGLSTFTLILIIASDLPNLPFLHIYIYIYIYIYICVCVCVSVSLMFVIMSSVSTSLLSTQQDLFKALVDPLKQLKWVKSIAIMMILLRPWRWWTTLSFEQLSSLDDLRLPLNELFSIV